jgi:hypothetical protein
MGSGRDLKDCSQRGDPVYNRTVSNTDKVNIIVNYVCKYWDYFKIYWQKTDKGQTRPLVRECAPKWQDSYFKKNRSLVKSPRLGSTPRPTDWLTVSCNVTLTLTLGDPVAQIASRQVLPMADRVAGTGVKLCRFLEREERLPWLVETKTNICVHAVGMALNLNGLSNNAIHESGFSDEDGGTV